MNTTKAAWISGICVVLAALITLTGTLIVVKRNSRTDIPTSNSLTSVASLSDTSATVSAATQGDSYSITIENYTDKNIIRTYVRINGQDDTQWKRIDNGFLNIGESKFLDLSVIGNQNIAVVDFRFWYGDNMGEYLNYNGVDFMGHSKWFRMRLYYQDGEYRSTYYDE